MARTALVVKCERQQKKAIRAINAGQKPKLGVRCYNRCKICGRNHGYLRKFKICRICFRELASEGKIMGVKKSSW